ncbi:MAG: hypothetical protein HN742_33670 [Lentisphaerae bacterium]|nr:hypothetical protein [Lentisphaerota bacterium]MBT4818876.1 hypothetical protein [Lentisphaerota bacterium]MBT5611412.1 hypothetical protein [Lentisphaerota bacterium]MBT7059640.1 hypothetical protein [Lentisphaerota bacterium]MBT7846869.1 hypothetical protein [Lentisphaerota bacterium]
MVPDIAGDAVLRLEKFLGGGFAGQVYRARLEQLTLDDDGRIPGLSQGGQYAVKIVIPPSPSAARFRNTMFWLAYQGPFSSQVNAGACRAGLLWQKMFRRGAQVAFGRETAIKDAYASFWDPELSAFGEITEWVEGRTWLLEVDAALWQRRRWERTDPHESSSREYVAKHQFMARMVGLLHDMGAPEFARQYEWWTMKSQPNVLLRTDLGDVAPEQAHCAIDFRAGIALLPFLPMSPGDFRLILSGLFRRRALVQFDRCDFPTFDAFVAEHASEFADLQNAIAELRDQDRIYRRSLPDVTHQGWGLLIDGELRRDVRDGLIEGYAGGALVGPAFAERLRSCLPTFVLFYLLGVLPIVGAFIRRFWGNAAYRHHALSLLASPAYFLEAARAKALTVLVEWHRAGRVSESRARWLADRPLRFLLEWGLLRAAGIAGKVLAFLVVFSAIWYAFRGLPDGLSVTTFLVGAVAVFGVCLATALPVIHRAVTNPAFVLERIKLVVGFILLFFRDAAFREQWFLDMLKEGRDEGMLSEEEHAAIAGRVRDPFIVKYLKCLAVHFATIPVTQVVSIACGAVAVAFLLAQGRTWADATVVFAAILVLFQVTPISPGSLCRGGYVLYLMIRERNLRDYLVAAPLSFVKYIGYLAFPLQMTTTYPRLARFLASRWATSAVHIVPVFGERGALFEHWIFDLAFNVPQMLATWCKPRVRLLLTVWMALGGALAYVLFGPMGLVPGSKWGINLIIALVCLFVFPRMVFYPLLGRRGAR